MVIDFFNICNSSFYELDLSEILNICFEVLRF